MTQTETSTLSEIYQYLREIARRTQRENAAQASNRRAAFEVTTRDEEATDARAA